MVGVDICIHGRCRQWCRHPWPVLAVGDDEVNGSGRSSAAAAVVSAFMGGGDRRLVAGGRRHPSVVVVVVSTASMGGGDNGVGIHGSMYPPTMMVDDVHSVLDRLTLMCGFGGIRDVF
ncbi:hypothetical protein Dimus_028959 [Dionaea muscipula]